MLCSSTPSGCLSLGATLSGGVARRRREAVMAYGFCASLNHRLISGMPPASCLALWARFQESTSTVCACHSPSVFSVPQDMHVSPPSRDSLLPSSHHRGRTDWVLERELDSEGRATRGCVSGVPRRRVRRQIARQYGSQKIFGISKSCLTNDLQDGLIRIRLSDQRGRARRERSSFHGGW